MSKFCVWVLETAVLCAESDRISHWEIWEAFNTKREAVKARNKGVTDPKFPMSKEWYRIRKYVPQL